jgi:protein SERAC1
MHSQGFYWPWELRNHLSHSRVMTFGYNADLNSSLATNFKHIKNVSSALLNALANKRRNAEVKHQIAATSN